MKLPVVAIVSRRKRFYGRQAGPQFHMSQKRISRMLRGIIGVANGRRCRDLKSIPQRDPAA